MKKEYYKNLGKNLLSLAIAYEENKELKKYMEYNEYTPEEVTEATMHFSMGKACYEFLMYKGYDLEKIKEMVVD